MKLNPTMLCDFYKVGHKDQYPEDTKIIYSTWTCRNSRIDGINSTIFFGLQGFIKDILITYFRENFFNRDIHEVLEENREAIEGGLGIINPDLSHIERLWVIGYLPLEISALLEGTDVPLRVPSFTIKNTHPEFFWLTNALETLISTETWSAITTSTIAREYRKILNGFAVETTGSIDGVEFQAHDFSMRGMCGYEHAAKAGCGHLLSFNGTDCIPSLFYLKDNYSGVIENCGIGGSIPATEHSVQCANMPEDEDETATIKRMITEVYPTGLLSMVLDTNDFWKNVTEVLPSLKNTIMKRDGKFVVRPDSGDPVDIICGTLDEYYDLSEWIDEDDEVDGNIFWESLREEVQDDTPHGEIGPDEWSCKYLVNGKYYEATVTNLEWNRYDKQYYFLDMYDSPKIIFKEIIPTAVEKGLIEVLWDIFGGITNELGYKVLDEHIGAIYGDSITTERARLICQKLKNKGFASTNIVLGVGSYSYAYHTRDTFGMAFKSTYALMKSGEKLLSKNPKTDSGVKKSQRGMVAVVHSDEGVLTLVDGLDALGKALIEDKDLLVPVFRDGKLLVDQTLEEIRGRVKKSLTS